MEMESEVVILRGFVTANKHMVILIHCFYENTD